MDIRHTKALLWNLGLVLLVAFSFVHTAEAQTTSQVDVLTVKGAITPILRACSHDIREPPPSSFSIKPGSDSPS